MKYDIRVGDYVETWDGHIGYIDDISIGKMTPSAYLCIDIRRCIGQRASFHGYEWQLPDYFKRIGRYDLTEVEKIDMLDTNTVEYKDDEAKALRRKINELIGKVNYLLDKQNKA